MYAKYTLDRYIYLVLLSCFISFLVCVLTYVDMSTNSGIFRAGTYCAMCGYAAPEMMVTI